jgi:hypothetical protein
VTSSGLLDFPPRMPSPIPTIPVDAPHRQKETYSPQGCEDRDIGHEVEDSSPPPVVSQASTDAATEPTRAPCGDKTGDAKSFLPSAAAHGQGIFRVGVNPGRPADG